MICCKTREIICTSKILSKGICTKTSHHLVLFPFSIKTSLSHFSCSEWVGSGELRGGDDTGPLGPSTPDKLVVFSLNSNASNMYVFALWTTTKKSLRWTLKTCHFLLSLLRLCIHICLKISNWIFLTLTSVSKIRRPAYCLEIEGQRLWLSSVLLTSHDERDTSY